MDIALAFLILGSLFGAGLAADEIGRRTAIPRVTTLLLLGLLAGPHGLDIVPPDFEDWYEFLATTALTMVAFLLGASLTKTNLKDHGAQIVIVSLVVVGVTILGVTLGLMAFGVPLSTALILSGIAAATAPAATLDVIKQLGAKGPLTDTLKGIVAIDDAWALISFSLILITVNGLMGDGAVTALSQGLWELFGAVLLGLGIGIPAAFLTGRIRPGEPMQSEALALVFVCAGAALWLDVSFLMTGIIAGTIIANYASHHTLAFNEIERIEWPFMILFFFLAGLSLHITDWGAAGFIVLAFVGLRTIARLIGGWIGGKLAGSPPQFNRLIGLALLPQAGVAIGMALIAGEMVPSVKETVLTVTIASTIVFELFGPIATAFAVKRSGEA